MERIICIICKIHIRIYIKYPIGSILWRTLPNTSWPCIQASYSPASTLLASHTFYPTPPHTGLFSSFSYPESFQLILSPPSTGRFLCLDHSPFFSWWTSTHASALSSSGPTQGTFPDFPMSNSLHVSFQSPSHLSCVAGKVATAAFLTCKLHEGRNYVWFCSCFCNYIP